MINIDKILHKLHFTELNPMQKAVLETGRKKQDLILLSPTGSGKTLVYLLLLLERLQPSNGSIQGIILVPSRELTLQIGTVFKSMGTDFRMCSCYGGHSVNEEKKSLMMFPDIIVGTPGRVLDHITRGNINANTIKFLVLDEFDKSLEFGFQDEMSDIISRLLGLQQRYLLSATDMDVIPDFSGLKSPIKLNFLEDGQNNLSRLRLMKVTSPEKDKLETLFRLLCTFGSDSIIVFCNYREAVERIGEYLHSKGFYSEIFHGKMEQEQRERAIYKFTNKSSNILVSTDLASRGLDIPSVEHIVHYHLPVNEDAYIHRNGRTARWDATGNSYLILHTEEKLTDYINQELEEYTISDNIPKPSKPLWTTLYIGKGKKDKLNKIDIVGFLLKKGNLNMDDIGQIDLKNHNAYVAIRRKKLKQLLTLIHGEKIKGMKTIIEEAN